MYGLDRGLEDTHCVKWQEAEVTVEAFGDDPGVGLKVVGGAAVGDAVPFFLNDKSE